MSAYFHATHSTVFSGEEEQQRSSELHHGAGYLAYEYLLAHYGLEKTVTWRSDRNTGNAALGRPGRAGFPRLPNCGA